MKGRSVTHVSNEDMYCMHMDVCNQGSVLHRLIMMCGIALICMNSYMYRHAFP